MTEHWQPPQISIQRLGRPGYGPHTSPQMKVSAQHLMLVHQTLISFCPGEREWFRLLNASLPSGTRPLTLETIPYHHYTHEFYWLAHHYAGQLCGNLPNYYHVFAQHFVQTLVPLYYRLHPPTQIARFVGNRLAAATIVPLEWKRTGFRSMIVCWDTDQALKDIVLEYQEPYLQTMVQLIGTLFHELPSLLGRHKTLFNENEIVNDQAHKLEWTIAWQEDTDRKGHIGLGAGVLLSIIVLTAVVLGASYLQWLILVPVLLGLGWMLGLKWREYAGQQEYWRHETIQQHAAQVTSLESLNQLDRELNRALSLERVIFLWFDWAIRLTFANAGGVVLVDSKDKSVQLVKSYGYNQHHTADWTTGIIGRSIRTGSSFYVPDTSIDPDYIALSPTTRSQFTVPVMHADNIVAVLVLEKDETDGFSTVERVRVARLCERASFALINAMLLEQTDQERRKLSTILSTITDVVIATDQHGHLTLINPAATQQFRLGDYRDNQNFLTIFDQTPLIEVFQQGLAANGYAHCEIEYQAITYEAIMVPIEQMGYLLVLHNITPFKELDNLKNDLVATVSHDLRNPLNAIKGYLDLIDMNVYLDGSTQVYMQKTLQVIDDMAHLIEGLLSVARLESGLLPDYRTIELHELLRSSLERHRLELDGKHMTLNMQIPNNLPTVRGDSSHISQIVHNLLSNAIKYSPPNSNIQLSIRPNGERVYISVIDNGIGIPEEALPTLFDKFTRVRDNRSAGIDGTGLGLYIVKKLVEAQEGEIWVQSKYGQGSTFTFTLPISQD